MKGLHRDPELPEKIRAKDRDALADLGKAESLFEFRRDAHILFDSNTTGDVTMDIYFTWSGLGGTGSLLIFGLYGAGTGPSTRIITGSLWLAAFGLVGLLLILKRLRRRFRSAARVRETIRNYGWIMDKRTENGELPETPPDWSAAEGMPPSLQGRGIWR